MENFMEIDSYGFMMSYCGDSFVYITNIFLNSNCHKNPDGTRSLLLNGGYLYSIIKRHLKSWDVPYVPLFLKKNLDVTRLDLSYNKIDSNGFNSIIAYVVSSDHLVEVDCRHNDITDVGINRLHKYAEKVKLKVLRLSGNKIGFEGAKKVALAMQKNVHVERLELADVDQTEESLIYFTTILRTDQEHFNKSLKVLDLSRPITKTLYYKFNSQHIAEAIGSMLRNNASLEELYLQKFDFSCHDIEALIENAKYNKTLKCLDLRCNNIGDHGMQVLSKWLEQRPTLQTLLLAHNNITNHGISALSRGMPFSQMIILDVSYNRFNDEGCIELLNSIKKSPKLEQLQIYGNNIGHATAKIVQRMLRSTVLNQNHIDVKIYEIDETLYFAYFECQTFQADTEKQLCSNKIITI